MNEITIYSPVRMAILMHIYCRPSPLELPESEVRSQTLLDFLHHGVIRDDPESGSGYSITDRGRAWINAILKTRLPRPAWVDAQGQVIPI